MEGVAENTWFTGGLRLKSEKFYNQQVIAGKKRNGTHACMHKCRFSNGFYKKGD